MIFFIIALLLLGYAACGWVVEANRDGEMVTLARVFETKEDAEKEAEELRQKIKRHKNKYPVTVSFVILGDKKAMILWGGE